MTDKVNSFIKLGKEKNFFPLYSLTDLAERWQLTVQGVHWLSKNHKNFPQPASYIFNSKNKQGVEFYPLCEVIRYERERGVNLEQLPETD
jgi:hypothetical protein